MQQLYNTASHCIKEKSELLNVNDTHLWATTTTLIELGTREALEQWLPITIRQWILRTMSALTELQGARARGDRITVGLSRANRAASSGATLIAKFKWERGDRLGSRHRLWGHGECLRWLSHSWLVLEISEILAGDDLSLNVEPASTSNGTQLLVSPYNPMIKGAHIKCEFNNWLARLTHTMYQFPGALTILCLSSTLMNIAAVTNHSCTQQGLQIYVLRPTYSSKPAREYSADILELKHRKTEHQSGSNSMWALNRGLLAYTQ